MSSLKKTAVLGASALLAVGGVGSTFVLAGTANADGQQATEVSQQSNVEVGHDTSIVKLATVEGQFDFTQDEVATNDYIAKNIGEASKYLCNAQGDYINTGAEAQDWTFAVTGAVENEMSMTLQEFRDGGHARSLIMGCTCMGNPADGLATANAEVTGVPLRDLFEMVKPAADANTVVFTSDDGYQVAVPLSYVMQRYAAIVFAVNDAPLAESVGGTNQLWLGSTPASYFARDIVSIELQSRETPPPSPTSDEARSELKNLPNVGVLYGGEVQ